MIVWFIFLSIRAFVANNCMFYKSYLSIITVINWGLLFFSTNNHGTMLGVSAHTGFLICVYDLATAHHRSAESGATCNACLQTAAPLLSLHLHLPGSTPARSSRQVPAHLHAQELGNFISFLQKVDSSDYYAMGDQAQNLYVLFSPGNSSLCLHGCLQSLALPPLHPTAGEPCAKMSGQGNGSASRSGPGEWKEGDRER